MICVMEWEQSLGGGELGFGLNKMNGHLNRDNPSVDILWLRAKA